MMDQKTFDAKVAAFRQTAIDPVARAEYAASRAEVILPLLNEQSTVRAIFKEERLAPGADARWDIPFEDIDVVYTMPKIGGIPMAQFEGSELHVDTQGMDAGVEYQMDVARDGRFPVGQLSTTLLKNKMIRQEEVVGWNLIRNHAATLSSTQQVQAWDKIGSVQVAGQGGLNVFTLNEAITTADEIGIGGRRITDVYCSPRRFGDLRASVGVGLALPDAVKLALFNDGKGEDTVSDVRIHRVYNTALLVINGVEYAYAFTQKEGFYYGVLPIREQLITRDNPISILEWKIGIIARQRLGFGVLDTLGLILISF